MAGNRAGGLKAAASNKALHGEDFYKRIGSLGGKNGNTGGFAADVDCQCGLIQGAHYVRQCAGKIGGWRSKRGKVKPVTHIEVQYEAS